MDPVFDAQYLTMKHSFSREDIEIEVAYTPAGEVDYVYRVGRLLAVDRDDNIRRLQEALPGLRRAEPGEQPRIGDLVVLSIDGAQEGHLTVPEALDLLDERLGEGKWMRAYGGPAVTPIHIVHTAKLCAATEPEVPCGCEPQPCPPPDVAAAGQDRVRLGISDTGLWEQPDPALHPWLAGVRGDPDPPGPTLPGGRLSILYDSGHGTFVAGVARCMAPGATVHVGNHFRYSGGELEYVLVSKLEDLIQAQSPDLINLSAGTYTRGDLPPLSFIDFRLRHPDITLVTAAGNDSTDREFWPAAFEWTISVGALGADQQNRAWFSNYGDWVDVYALGEGMVNAFATGVYTYQEPPKRPAKQVFRGMARWDGTSFSAPLVAGLIVAEMARTDVSAADAWPTVLATATEIDGVGPALFPPQCGPVSDS